MIFPKANLKSAASFLKCHLLLIILLFTTSSISASSTVDSLKHQIKHSTNDKEKLEALISLSNYYEVRNHDSTEAIILQALALSKSIKDYTSEAASYNNLGLQHSKKSKYKEARKYYDKALVIAIQNNLKSQEAALYGNYAITYQREYQQDSAYVYLIKAEQAYALVSEEDRYELWKIYFGLFELFSSKMEIEPAREYGNKALEIVKKGNNRIDRGYLLFRFLHFYLTNDIFDEAGYFREEWQKFQLEKKTSQQLMEIPEHIALYMFDNEEGNQVERQLLKAIAYFESKENTYRVGWTYEDLGNLYLKRDDYDKAEAAFKNALQYFRSSGAVFRKGSVLYQMYKLYKKNGEQQKALSFLERYKSVADSISGVEIEENLNELKVQYQTEQKEQELRIQKLEIDQKTQERNFFVGSSLMFALLAGGIFIILRQRLQSNRKLAVQAFQLQEQRIQQLEQEKRLSSMSAMIEGQEKERFRIANDLHDSLGGLLTAAKAQFTKLLIISKNETSQKATKLLEDAAVELRRISHNLMPRSLSLLGIKGALEDIAVQIRQSDINCEMEIVGIDKELPETTSIMIYRIIQELSNNIIKHAKANNVLIQLIKHEAGLLLVVEDDGKGFDLLSALNKKSLGMNSLHSRVEFLKGELEIDTTPGEGTIVTIEIPVT